jgi:hypothetical protein
MSETAIAMAASFARKCAAFSPNAWRRGPSAYPPFRGGRRAHVPDSADDLAPRELQTFKDFPPRQKAGPFAINDAWEISWTRSASSN